jgi:hypothetical protein
MKIFKDCYIELLFQIAFGLGIIQAVSDGFISIFAIVAAFILVLIAIARGAYLIAKQLPAVQRHNINEVTKIFPSFGFAGLVITAYHLTKTGSDIAAFSIGFFGAIFLLELYTAYKSNKD